MELYHYTEPKNIPSIKEIGLLPYKKSESTIMINQYLEQYSKQKHISHLRETAIYFYNIEQYDEDDELEGNIAQVSVRIEDLNIKKLYVANWEYAECIYALLKERKKQTDEKEILSIENQLKSYANKYIQSIKPYKQIEDIWMYESTELLYLEEIQANYLDICTL